MRKNLYCFFNSPYLGGAERSFIQQAQDLRTHKPGAYNITFFIPYLEKISEAEAIKSALVQSGFSNSKIVFFKYSRGLYSLSRSGSRFLVFKLMSAFFGLLLVLRSLSRLSFNEPDVMWVNGNKSAIVLFLYCLIFRFKCRFLWHFRDYPAFKSPLKQLYRVGKLFPLKNIEFIGNSLDVTRHLLQISKNVKAHSLYNPVSEFQFQYDEKKEFVIGGASMFAPWKGLHELIIFCGLFEKELKKLGVKEFHIYGDEIYRTDGDHSGYKENLISLNKKLGSDLIKFMGLKNPELIFQNLDVFIHSSTKPEPFGRVILESYKSGTLLISTGLGGAKELISDGKSGLIYKPHDFKGLMNAIEKSLSRDRANIIQNGLNKASAIQKKYEESLLTIF